jgi:membrane protease YdiL (CAAX protease family)
MRGTRAHSDLAIFFALLLLSSGVLTAFALLSGFAGAVALLMWCVGMSAMAALKLTGRPLAELGWNWGETKFHVLACALPALYCVLTYCGAAFFGLVRLAPPEKIDGFVRGAHTAFLGPSFGAAAAFAVILCAGMLQTMTNALGEEIGWRGFLVPRLVDLWGFVGGALGVGAVWCAWHMPLIVLGNYNSGGDLRFELASFAVMVLAMSGPIAWLRLRAQSLWPCVTFHAAHNLIVQGIFDPLTVRGPNAVTMVGEFGVVMACVVSLVSLPFWVLGLRLPPAETQAYGRAG